MKTIELTINNSLNKIGYSFAGKKARGRFIGGNIPYILFNNEVIHHFRYPFADKRIKEMDKILENMIKRLVLLEENILLFEMFMKCILSKYQYFGWLRKIEYLNKIRLTKKEVDNIMNTLGAGKIRWRNEMDFRYRASQTTYGFILIFKNYFSVPDNWFLEDDLQSNLLKCLKLNIDNKEDEMCLIGLISGEVNEMEYLGYLRAKKILREDKNRITRNKRSDGENKNIEILYWYVGNIPYRGGGKIINKTEVGYGIEVSFLSSMQISNGYFSLLKMERDNEIIYGELKWWDENKDKIGIYCPRYIRSQVGTFK
ncbi:TPA: hypothetical protein DCX16_03290 [bacterium]|nr:hypothetical protein [bacterium]